VSDPLPTKTVRAPDGSLIHYPDLPGVGEKYQPPSAAAHEVHGQQSTQPPDPRPTSSASNESWRERVMSAARSAVERAGLYGHAAVNALVLDDWKALTDAHSSTLSASKAGAGLASWAIPEGKVAEIAGHAIVKAGEFAAAHAAEQSAEHAIASGVEHAAEHTQEAVVAGKKWAERTSNQKLAEQHPTNPSTIWDRPLTAAERGRAFKNADDATAFMGPATERGGELKDWHHNVEKVTPTSTASSRPNKSTTPRMLCRCLVRRIAAKMEYRQNLTERTSFSAQVPAKTCGVNLGKNTWSAENSLCEIVVSIPTLCAPRHVLVLRKDSSYTIASTDSRKATKQPPKLRSAAGRSAWSFTKGNFRIATLVRKPPQGLTARTRGRPICRSKILRNCKHGFAVVPKHARRRTDYRTDATASRQRFRRVEDSKARSNTSTGIASSCTSVEVKRLPGLARSSGVISTIPRPSTR